MTTYIDALSIAPTVEDAKARCENLSISGHLIGNVRDPILCGAQDGDIVICGPRALAYWRRLPTSVCIVSITNLNDSDPLPKRAKGTVAMEQCGDLVEAKEAFLADLLYIQSKMDVPVERPYLWKLFTDRLYNEVQYMFENYKGVLGIDVETDIVLDHPNEMYDKLVGIGIAFDKDCYYGMADNAEWMSLMVEWLPRTKWIGHNAKYDREILHRHGIRTGKLVGDSMLAAYLLGVRSASLKSLVKDRYKYRMATYEELVGKGKKKVPISKVDQSITASYCCADAYFALRLEADIRRELGPNQLLLYEMDIKLAEIVGDMEEEGMPFDRESASATLVELESKDELLASALNKIAIKTGYENPPKISTCKGCKNGKNKRWKCPIWQSNHVHHAGLDDRPLKCCCPICRPDLPCPGKFSTPVPINLGSTDQVGRWLHEILKLPIQGVTASHKPQVDSLVLLRLRDYHYVPKLLLEWRQREKYIGYLKSWLKWSQNDSRLHPVFTMSRTRTGRLSSQDPNCQQVMVDWRTDFIAPEGRELLAFDYAQIEVRIPAFMSKDPVLMKVAIAGNIHAENTYRLFGIPYEEQGLPHNIKFKTRAKNYWFGAAYGSKGYEIQTVLEEAILKSGNLDIQVPTLKEIMAGVSTLHDIYGQYFLEWVPSALYRCREKDGWTYTLWGRPQYLPEIFSKDKQEREHAERQCISHIVQGTAGDFLRAATCGVKAYINSWNSQQIMPNMSLHLSVHDELVLSAVNAKSHISGIKEVMELGQPIMPIPLVADVTIGIDWKSCHK